MIKAYIKEIAQDEAAGVRLKNVRFLISTLI